MSVTLRRKMFKLGGEVSKTHGVGITSNLNYNKGGKVAPIGSDVYPKVQGPDGQMREAHFGGMFLAPAGAILRSGAGLLSRGLGRFGMSPKFLTNFGSKGGVKDFVLKSSTGSTRPSAKQLARMTPEEIARTVGKFGFGPTGRGAQALRAAQLALAPTGIAGTAAGLGTAAAQRAGLINPIEADDAPFTKFGKLTAQGLADFNLANALSMGIQKGMGVEDAKSFYELVAGGPKVETLEEIKTMQQDEQEGMKTMTDKANARAAEIYKMLGGGQQNKFLIASKALAEATPFVAEGEYGKAAAAAGAALADSGEEDKKIAQEAALMTIDEIKQEEQLKQSVVAELMGQGEVETAVEAERAYEAGKQIGSLSGINRLPLKSDGKHDTALTQTGVVYTDLTNVSGFLFIAYNSDEQPLKTNDYQAALNHSRE